mmetsp:Transcript_7074/g.21755  ORF Transcript_7074/g.21755 Transcript_7074/m.21755 type:complete len:214 (+) Transcript_7074:3137-3778(+)
MRRPSRKKARQRRAWPPPKITHTLGPSLRGVPSCVEANVIGSCSSSASGLSPAKSSTRKKTSSFAGESLTPIPSTRRFRTCVHSVFAPQAAGMPSSTLPREDMQPSASPSNALLSPHTSIPASSALLAAEKLSFGLYFHVPKRANSDIAVTSPVICNRPTSCVLLENGSACSPPWRARFLHTGRREGSHRSSMISAITESGLSLSKPKERLGG